MSLSGSPFVGREGELGRLVDAVGRAREGEGSTIFIAGELGSGKQALIDELERRVRSDPELAETHFARGSCSRHNGADNAYDPFVGLLLDLIADERGGKKWTAIFDAVKETAPEWLGMVPIAGPAIQAGVKTAIRAHEIYASEAEEERARRTQSRHMQFVAALDARLEHAPAVIMEVSQAQWIDESSVGLLERVARLITERPVVLLVTYRPADLSDKHHLPPLERALRMDRVASTIALSGFDEAEVDAVARHALGHGVAPDAARWLVSLTDGNPLYVTELLPVLVERGLLVEQDGSYRIAANPEDLMSLAGGADVPLGVSDALDERLERLDPDLRDLLGMAAVEGSHFHSTTLARVAQLEDTELLRRLGDVEERHKLIRFSEALQRRLFRYEFAHLLLHQRAYERLSTPVRVQYHSQVAEALVETWGDEAPRPMLIAIARHYEAGYEYAAAARHLLTAAESAQLDGASPEAANLARRALALLDQAEGGPRAPDTSATRAELVALLVGTQWEAVHGRDAALRGLIDRGVAAAEQAKDPALLGRLLHAKARYLLGTEDAREAIACFRRAAELAAEGGDAVAEVAARIDLGNTLNIESLERGLPELEAALRVYEDRVAPLAEGNTELARLHARLVAFIGIGAFDAGDLGTGRRRLDESVARLEAIQRPDDLPRILNYRAQVALARGDFQAAVSDLEAALRLADAESPWSSANTAFLGKALVGAGDIFRGEAALREAWAAAEARWQVRLGTIVRQLLAEFLLRPGSSPAEVDEAERLLARQVADSARGGFDNMLTVAESLLAEVYLRRGTLEDACTVSTQAVQRLEESGQIALVSTEEILWRHGRSLAAAGKDGADAYLDRARAELRRKAGSLEDQADRTRFLQATPVARDLNG